ncbi:MAG: endopeptidase La [Clostridia bacterium]
MEETQGLVIPVLALRGLTAFPKMHLHFDVGRAMSVKALEKAMKDKQQIFLVAQERLSTEKPTFDDLYKIGTICKIKQILKMPNEGSVRVLVEGESRGIILNEVREKPFLVAEIGEISDYNIEMTNQQKQAISRKIIDKFDEYLDFQQKVSPDILTAVVDKISPQEIADFIAQNIPIENAKKQRLLEERNAIKRSVAVIEILTQEIEILKIQDDIARKVKASVDKNQKEFYLREQLKAVLDELGENEGVIAEYDRYVQTIEKLPIEQKNRDKLLSEAKKMRRLGSSSQEGAVIRNYLEFVLNLPFDVVTKEKKDLVRAKKELDANHFGLEKVKERILQTLALREVSGNKKGCVICLVGPPGVGKTSIASSVAKAMGRNMARVSLGGVRDEAEIRGHRKTYIGAMCGKIIKAMNEAKTANPLILLDEIDKMTSDMRGDPASAMLEVLDFEQNSTFADHYLDIPYDLSQVIFIATANNLGTIPKPLLDRMEVIELSSYTKLEKFHIAQDHIVPKIIKKYNLKRIKLSGDAINDMISGYTREAGVRALEQNVEKIMRKIALKMVTEGQKTFNIDTNLEEYLGKPRYTEDAFSKKDQIGIVNGLAYTSVGGVILRVEVNAVSGDGKVKLTGNLGKVMQESAEIALSYTRSIAKDLGLEENFHKKYDLHIHFPEGATPKDGPSAGITMATAIISALTGKPVHHDVAMTGEISLRGNVMPIGGLREKSMAAYQNGIKKVIISRENQKDLEELDLEVLENVEFIIADTMHTVLKNALISNETEDIKFLAKEILIDAVIQ